MKKITLSVIIVFSLLLSPISAHAQGLNLSQLVELFIGIGVISPDKVDAARAVVAQYATPTPDPVAEFVKKYQEAMLKLQQDNLNKLDEIKQELNNIRTAPVPTATVTPTPTPQIPTGGSPAAPGSSAMNNVPTLSFDFGITRDQNLKILNLELYGKVSSPTQIRIVTDNPQGFTVSSASVVTDYTLNVDKNYSITPSLNPGTFSYTVSLVDFPNVSKSVKVTINSDGTGNATKD